MPMFANRLLVGLGLIGSLTMLVVLLVQIPQVLDQVVLIQGPQVHYDLLPLLRYCLSLVATVFSVFATSLALTKIDETGILYEGRVTSITPLGLAGCGLALVARWMPDRLPVAIAWLILQVPGAIVGLTAPTSTLQQKLRRQQSAQDKQIGVAWELKQLTNRVNLLQRLTQPGGPDPEARKKLATTGNTLEKYYAETRKQLDLFLNQTSDEALRSEAMNMLQILQAMDIGQ